VNTIIDNPVIDDATREAGSGRSPASGPPARPRRRLGGTLILVALGAFGVTRFIVAEPSTTATAPRVVTELATISANDLAALQAAAEQRPEDLRAIQALGVAYVRAASTDPANYALARAAFDRADRIRPDDTSTQLGRGLLSMSLHRFDDALAQADGILATNPDLDAAHQLRFDALMEIGRYDEAETTIERLLATEPGLPAYTRVSYLRQVRGDMDGAISAMRQAVTAGDAMPAAQAEALALLGDLYFIEGDLDRAEVERVRALELDPELPLAQFGLAEVLAAQGDLTTAEAMLERLVQRWPAPAALIVLGDVRATLGDQVGAQAAYEQAGAEFEALAAAGEIVDLERSFFEFDHGDPDLGLRLAREAYQGRPESVLTADALAWALHLSGDVDGAREMATKALRYGTVDHPLNLHSRVILAEESSAGS
jgi:tetratricopeptide (TPR) repeat protein